MGTRGPVGKRSDRRLGHQSKERRDAVTKADGSGPGDPPKANSKWHPIAKRWYESLAMSGQSKFYEPSDWATAYLLAETMSRELRPQGLVYQGAVVSTEHMTVKAGVLAALLKGMSDLLVTEGARRRVTLELQHGAQPSGEGGDPAPVTDLRSWREQLGG